MRFPGGISGEIEVRPARLEDLDAVANLLLLCELPRAGLRGQFPEVYAVAELERRIVAAAGVEVHGSFGLLRSVAVAPEIRGGGAGGALVQDRLRWAAMRGLTELYLLTTTAAGYFPRFGFEAVDRAEAPEAIRNSREFAGACPSTATLMRRRLKSSV